MSQQAVLCRYSYDALDRLAIRTPLSEAVARVFYQSEGVVSELQGAEHWRLLRHDRQLLAGQSALGATLMGSDQQHSVLAAVQAGSSAAIAYTAFGHRPSINHLPGFNGEQPDPVTGHYLLGNGYRAYNPVLMRFNSPDSLSPFGEGGLNAYAYCAGDPVNRSDPTGHVDFSQILSFTWVGLGLVGALVGGKLARPALSAVLKGGAPVSTKLSAAAAVTQVVASTVFTASRIINAVEPDSPAPDILLGAAIFLAVPTIGVRLAAPRWKRLEDAGANITVIGTRSRPSVADSTTDIRRSHSTVTSSV
ncbi:MULTISPECIES: RHS repeat-associated core domain-containing protein [Pseudomonas syringae group]|uniref:RHS repeat-associated core domain-containing protein n=4 Tax=Pseudomonas syringae group TaxID=136849 RepID=A0AAD0GSL8_9PSED|nr:MULTISPECIES: RHS repeat-associated core domain-containing protein [Pseudomonas syringae group]AVB22511.1 RHS repeat-associated core domain-containing protein [Pseudomonas avellanae]EGH08158.1 hypothetical protein PSYMP_05644 [Pseudomonas amygdali pv. morsprunorum str. M302280]KWS66284.1 hypothetical protein AL055_22210 [Pseudomonas amygdali pv. morsprunorum]PHN37586.1 hypothetical protein AO261_24675 [Pseudomonas avellanae]POC95380.1 RHS repeat-associated core domain-containing protein [Ps